MSENHKNKSIIKKSDTIVNNEKSVKYHSTTNTES